MISLSDDDVGAKLRKARERLGISQAALAADAGIRQATLSSVENGGNAMMSTLRAIRDALTKIRQKGKVAK